LLASLLTLSYSPPDAARRPPCSAAATPADTAAPQRLTIVTNTYPAIRLCPQIAGEYADIAMLLPPGSESHSYEPTPQDILKIQNCDFLSI
jgi:zinc transport system substrate-binding protein